MRVGRWWILPFRRYQNGDFCSVKSDAYDQFIKGWGMAMATTQVILYFDSPADALRFTLAASSALANDGKKGNDHPELSREIKRASRIRAEDVTFAAK